MGVRCNTSNVSARLLGIKGPPGKDGEQGIQGIQGEPGIDGVDGLGVPAGGDTDDVLTKRTSADNDTYWANASSGAAWIVKTTTYLSINKDNIVGDTSGGSFSIILPANPDVGWQVRIKSTVGYQNNLTIVRNGRPIMSDDEDYVINGDFIDLTFVYINATLGWII